MKKTAIIFPGQGSQYIGMGQAFLQDADFGQDAKAIMDKADAVTGCALSTLCADGPMEELTRVNYLQPALTAINLMCWHALKASLPDFTPVCVAGHSLGEYSALYAAGVISLDDTLALVTKRGELMQREGEKNPGGMRAILGAEKEELEQIFADNEGPGVAVLANHNTPNQIVISGDEPGLDRISVACAAAGFKVIPLKVSVANHSPLVAGATEDFTSFMNPIAFQNPTVPVLSNVTGSAVQDGMELKNIMEGQLASPVRWVELVASMVDLGIELVVELGPKNVLTGMMRKNISRKSGIKCLQADSPEGLAKVIEAIQ